MNSFLMIFKAQIITNGFCQSIPTEDPFCVCVCGGELKLPILLVKTFDMS